LLPRCTPPPLAVRGGLNLAGFAPRRNPVSLWVVFGDGLYRPAFATRLPPHSFASLTTTVVAFVGQRIEQLKVLNPVVEFVVIDVMNSETSGNGPVYPLPDQIMLHAEPLGCGIVKPPITFCGDSHVWVLKQRLRFWIAGLGQKCAHLR